MASESTRRQAVGGLGGGRAERNFVRRWDGVVHAVAPGSDATLCGRPLSTLHPFPDHTFDGVRLDDRCVHCVKAAGEPTECQASDKG